MAFDRFLPRSSSGTPSARSPIDAEDTATVRRIVGQLDAMPRDRARFLAAFAYILTRAASADLDITDAEEVAIEGLLEEHGGLAPAQAVLVAELARTQSLLYGGTEDYLVTRQFRDLSTDEERLALLRCCYVVSAVDDTITSDESDVLQEIARELDVERHAVNAIRTEFAPKLSAMKAMMRLREQRPG